jgi:hypothetical protein
MLAYNVANFLRTLALPAEVSRWSMTMLRERLVKIGARIVRRGRSMIFQMADVMLPRRMFAQNTGRYCHAAPDTAGTKLSIGTGPRLSGI